MSAKQYAGAFTCLTVATQFELGALEFAIWSAAGGHGSYLPARVLFPFTMLTTLAGGEISRFGVIAAIAQFPLYGCVIAWGVLMGRGRATAILIALAHFNLVLFALIVVSYETFPVWRFP